MLDTLLQSKLATRDDSDIVQVIAEHTALDVDVEGSLGGNGEQQPPEVEIRP